MAKPTLLQMAFATPRRKLRKRATKDELETFLAWMRDQIGISQVATALHRKTHSNLYSRMLIALRTEVIAGRLLLTWKP